MKGLVFVIITFLVAVLVVFTIVVFLMFEHAGESIG